MSNPRNLAPVQFFDGVGKSSGTMPTADALVTGPKMTVEDVSEKERAESRPISGQDQPGKVVKPVHPTKHKPRLPSSQDAEAAPEAEPPAGDKTPDEEPPEADDGGAGEAEAAAQPTDDGGGDDGDDLPF